MIQTCPPLQSYTYRNACHNRTVKLKESSQITIARRTAQKETEMVKHEKYAKIAFDTISDNDDTVIENYKRIHSFQNKETGFNGSLYENKDNNEIVISYRCTNNKAGVESDIQMVECELPDQYDDAIKMYEYIKKTYPHKKITLVGYSLGASLAQLVASTYPEVQAITFEGYGTLPIIKANNLNDNQNTINYTISDSIVSSTTPHPGITRTIDKIPIQDSDGELIKTKTRKVKKKKHNIKHFFHISKAKYTPEFKETQKRFNNMEELMETANNILKKFPQLKRIIPNCFFKNEEE